MLDAKDRMSRPLLSAARASQQLSGRVERLTNTLNSSRSSVVNASVANRILGERYRELGRRIAGADEQVKISTRLFRALPAPIRLAAYVVEGYAKAMWKATTQNVLARTATKLLVGSFKLLRIAVSNISWDIERVVKAMWKFSRLGKVVSLMVWPFKMVAQGAKLAANAILRMGKNTFVYQLLKTVVKDVGYQIKLTAINQMNFIKQIPQMMKGTRAWYAYQSAVLKTKQSIVSARLAFELWKNSSNAAKKISNVFEDIGWHAKQLWNTIKKNVDGMRQLGNATANTGTRGRATFNALTDANARLNRELGRLNGQLTRADSKLGKMKSSLSALNAIGLAFSAAYAAQAAMNTGERMIKGTVGKAMEQNYSAASVSILAGPEQGAKFYEQISSYAASTAYATEDWARNMRGAISKSKNVDDLRKYQVVLEQLATLDPIQGLDGAALAVRELNSGDIVSLVERFELPRSALKEIKDITDPIAQIEALSKLVGDNTGYTVDNIEKMKKLPLMQWQKMTNSIKTAFGYMGKEALEKLAPLMTKFNEMWDSGKFKSFIGTMGSAIGSFATSAINFFTKIYTKISDGSLQASLQPFIDVFNNVKATIAEAWPVIQPMLSDMKSILAQIATTVSDNWPTINALIQEAVQFLGGIADWAENNWPEIESALIGAVAGFGAFKILTTVTSALALFRNGTLLATAANWLMTTSLWAVTAAIRANPIVFLVSIVIALGVALYTAYQKSDKFKAAVQGALGWLKDKGVAALELGKKAIDGIKEGFKGAVTWVDNLLGKFSEFVRKVTGFKMPTFGMPKFMGGSGIISKNDKNHHGGLNRVPYDGYQATLHKGERVLTRSEVNGYGQNGAAGNVTVTGNTFIVRDDNDIDSIADALLKKLTIAKTAMG